MKHIGIALVMVVLSILIPACGTGPSVKLCISTPSEGGFECFDETTQKSYFVKYEDSDKYVSLPPADAQTLFNYCQVAK